MKISVDKVLNAKGLSCPMPMVKTMDYLEPGQVVEVQATDQGSLADIQAWARSTGHHYLGTRKEGDVLKHYVRKAHPGETKGETKHPHVADLEELRQKLDAGEKFTLLDVREPAEFAFGHIPGAKSIPLGELELRLDELNREHDIYVICRTGNRSDVAAQMLVQKGFKRVKNIIPGMTEWTGPTEKN